MAIFRKKNQPQTTTAPEKEPLLLSGKLNHIAFIMDGNGRWAQRRGLQRSLGHVEGMKTFDRIMNHCSDIGIPHVTVYAFSTENWKRPRAEIDTIMRLLSSYIDRAAKELNIHKTEYHFIGDKTPLPAELRKKAENLEQISRGLPLTLNIGLNYGSHAEITMAVNRLLSEGKTAVTEEDLAAALFTAHSPYPDLLVRTGGEYRLSNFLLWQLAYTELSFTDILWPDLTNDRLDDIIREFLHRNRTFGAAPKNAENGGLPC